MKKAWVVLPAGAAYEPGTSDYEVLGHTEIYMGESLSAQLLNISEEVEVLGILTPPDMSARDQQLFKDSVNVAWCGLQTSRATIRNLYPQWIKASHYNFNRLSTTLPVDQLQKKIGTRRAVVCANGPSLREALEALKSLDDIAIFSCWHSAHKVLEAGLGVDFLCHTDNAIPAVDFKPGSYPFDTVFISSPKAAPAFVELSRHYQTYTYIPSDVPVISGLYAEALNCTEHDPIVSTVASMTFNCAVYAGYDEIILAGVDNGWVHEADAYPECAKSVGVENQHGITVQTYAPFALAALGIENKIDRTPGLKVYQTTKNALSIRGVEFKDFRND